MKKKSFSSILVFAFILIFSLSLVGIGMAQLKPPQQSKPQTYQEQPTIQRQPTVTTPLNQPAQIWQTLIINAFQINPRETCKRNISMYIAGRGYEYRVSEYEDFRGAPWKSFRSGTVPFRLGRTKKTVCYSRYHEPFYNDNNDYCYERRIVYAQLRDKQDNKTAPKQAEVQLAPELKYYSVSGTEAWNLAKKKGAKCRLIKCYPASNCNSNAIPGYGFTHDRSNPEPNKSPVFCTEGVTHVNGGKFEFDVFYSFNLNPGWTFVDYFEILRSTSYNLISSHGHVGKKILSQPQPGGRNIYLKVRMWADPTIHPQPSDPDVRIAKRRAWYLIKTIDIKGPNCRDPLDAFR